MLVLQEKTAVFSILHSLKRVITCGRNTGQHYNNDVELWLKQVQDFICKGYLRYKTILCHKAALDV